MLTQEDDVEIHALAKRGWSISAIARHTGRDRKTVRAYLRGKRHKRKRPPSCLEPYRDYLEARFTDDHHVLATVLHRELAALGFDRSYQTLVRELRRLGLRPTCPACRNGQLPTTEIPHEPGEELQLDWWELRETPWGEKAYVLVGALSHSGRSRAVFTEGQSFPHLVAALDGILRRLGGTAKAWRTDRMATVVDPDSGQLRAQFAAVAKHYGAKVDICPSYRPQRKGVVEAAVKYLTRSWWRSAPVSTPAQAQADLDRFCATVGDARRRPGGTVGSLADAEPLLSLPASPFPAELETERTVDAKALVHFEGNRYSVPPELLGQTVTVRARLGELDVEIVSAAGRKVARHRRAPAGAAQTIRDAAHASALERAVLDAFSSSPPCARKANRPPGEAALVAAARIRGDAGKEVAIDLDRYAQIAGAAR